MKITIDIPQNASIREIVQAVISVTDYDGLIFNKDECSCCSSNIGPCDDLVCKLAYFNPLCEGCEYRPCFEHNGDCNMRNTMTLTKEVGVKK